MQSISPASSKDRLFILRLQFDINFSADRVKELFKSDPQILLGFSMSHVLLNGGDKSISHLF